MLDSSGLKIYGEGEWKVRQHGVGKRRTWRKLHIALDPHSQEIIVGELTLANEADGPKGADLLSKVPKTVRRAFGDGGYDGRSFRKAAKQREIRPIVPPPRNARMSSKNTLKYPERDEAIAVITGLGGGEGGRKAWEVLSGYHIRSLVETTFSRLKTLFGAALRSRTVETQRTEAHTSASSSTDSQSWACLRDSGRRLPRPVPGKNIRVNLPFDPPKEGLRYNAHADLDSYLRI